MAANETGIPIMIGGRRYWFNPDKYFAADQHPLADAPLVPDDERLQHLVRGLTGQQGESSGADGEA